MTKYTWNGSTVLYRPTENIMPGEEFEPSESEVSAFGDLMREKPGSDTEDPKGSGGEDTTPECTKEDCSRKVKGGGYCWQHEDE